MKAISLNNISIAEYISFSQEQDQKYEYHDGSIFAMAGGSIEHGLIGGNFFGVLDEITRSQKSTCFPLNSDVRLHVKKGNKIFYPDVMIVYNEIVRSETEKESITNPTVIVEVLSESTESYDRGDKFYFYQEVYSLKEYILVSQDKIQIDVFKRANENMWSMQRYEGAASILNIEAIGAKIAVEAIYRNVEFIA